MGDPLILFAAGCLMTGNLCTTQKLATLRGFAAADVQHLEVGAACRIVAERLHCSPAAVRYQLAHLWSARLIKANTARLTELGWLAVNGADVAA